MTISSNPFKGQKAGKIINSAFFSTMTVLMAGSLIGITSYKDPPSISFVFLGVATILLVISILIRSKASIDTETRIDKLQERIEKLEKSKTD